MLTSLIFINTTAEKSVLMSDDGDVLNVPKCSISRSRCTNNRLTAGLCPDPVEKFSAVTDRLASVRGNRPQGWQGKGRESIYILVKRRVRKGGKWTKGEES